MTAEPKLPTLSVVIPNYNHSQYLPDCLRSVLTQSIQADEIIIIDDCSTDKSVEVIEALQRKAPQIRFLRNEKNRGCPFTSNRGVAEATGDFVIVLGADDEVRAGFFEKSLRILARHPQAGFSATICEYRDMDSGLTWFLGQSMGNETRYFSPEEMVRLSRQNKLLISTGSIIANRRAFLEAGGYNEELQWHCDWFVQFVSGFRHGICFVTEPLAEFRIYRSGFSGRGMREKERQLAVLRKLLELLDDPRYQDAAERLRRANALSSFGWDMLRLLASERRYWKYLTPSFLLASARWIAKLTARRLLPDKLARLCLRLAGYHKLPRPAAVAAEGTR